MSSSLQRGSLINSELLKKYIRYSKETIGRVRVDQKSASRLEDFYVSLRQESRKSQGLNVVVRHLESLVRLATASARAHLRRSTND